jgi:hypothetical protein
VIILIICEWQDICYEKNNLNGEKVLKNDEKSQLLVEN